MLKHLDPYIPAIGLGVTQIMGYGTLMYAYAVLLPHMADDLSLTLSTVFGVLSLGLFFGGLASPVAGMLVDRFGGRYVMTFGSIVAAIALASLSLVEGVIGLFLAILLVEGAGRFVLYNVAFASVARLDNPVPAKKSISIITLFGGVASTIFWPLTLALYNGLGWQNTWVVMGVALGVVCVPIHFWALRGPQKDHDAPQSRNDTDWPELAEQDRMRGMLWMVLSFVFTGYIMGAIMSLWVVNVQDLGHSAGIAALAGAVIGG